MSENCTIKGYLYGDLCEHLRVFDALAEADLYFVPSRGERRVLPTNQLDQIDLKSVIRTMQDEEMRAVQANAALLRARTGKNGAFCLNDQRYQGEALDVYACIDRVPTPTLQSPSMPLPSPVCLYLGTFVPDRTEEGWYMILRIPHAVWCRLKRLADAWTIVGKVTACDGDQAIGAVTVTAKDVDFTQDDLLGSAVTNASGIFRIDYPGANYRQGTFIDVELFGGPDVYFKIEDSSSNVLLDEPPSKGRTAGRADRGPCMCVDLCVDIPGPGVETVPSAWTDIGTAFSIPDSPASLNDFNAEGYAGAAQYAFTGHLRLTGSAPRHTAGGHPVEYRFLVSNTTAANSDPDLPAGNFTRIVGVSPNDNLFLETEIGKMIRFSPYKTVKVTAKLVDLDADGWLDVNKSITRAFVDDPAVDPLDIPNFFWIDEDALMGLNTASLTTAPDVPLGVAGPGEPVPAANQIGIEKIAIRFEAREVIDKATNNFNTLPGSGKTLNAMVVNNNPSFMKLAMKEHLDSGNPCGVLSGQIHAAYTVHHPHLQSVSLRVTSNDGSFDAFLEDAPQNLTLSGNTNAAITHLHNPALSVNNNPAVQAPHPVQTLHRCSYLVTLNVVRRLHNGDSSVSSEQRQTTFYYETP